LKIENEIQEYEEERRHEVEICGKKVRRTLIWITPLQGEATAGGKEKNKKAETCFRLFIE
jgi:hypothetical protein